MASVRESTACVRCYTLSLLLAIQLDICLAGLLPKGDDTLPHGRCSRRPVTTLLWCKPRQSKRSSSIHFVQSRNCDNLLSSLFIVPPSFVDCCFKRRAKLISTMVPSLSSGLPSLFGCFRCPPPPTLAASHGRRHTSSPVRYPHSRRFNVTVVVAGSSRRRRDAAGGGTTRNRRRRR